MAQLVKNPPASGTTGFDPWVGKIPGFNPSIPWRTWQPTPVFLPGESPWTEEPGGLQSTGLQRVRHDWVTKHMLITWHLESSIAWFQPQVCLLPVPVNLTSTLDLDLWLGPTLRVSVNPVKAGSTQGGKLNGAIRGVYHKSRPERWARELIQLLSRVWLIATPRTTALQASLSITNSRSLLKLMSIESVMPSNHLILCCPLLLLPSIFPSIRVSSYESVLHIRWPKYWSFSFSTSPSNEHSGLISCVSGHPKCQSVPLDWYWEFFGIIH